MFASSSAGVAGLCLVVAVTAPVCAQVQSSESAALIVGRLIAPQSPALPIGTIAVDGVGATTSDARGAFRLTVPSGTRMLRVRAVGFIPIDTMVVLDVGRTLLELTLQRSPVLLDSVRISASGVHKPARYATTTKFDAFYERRQTAVGGRFFTREDIERSGRNDVPDLLKGIAGIRIERDRMGLPTIRIERCVSAIPVPASKSVQVFVDGMRVMNSFETLDLIKSGDIEALEVYQGVAQLPEAARGDGCAAIFVWTRYSSGSVLAPRPQ